MTPGGMITKTLPTLRCSQVAHEVKTIGSG
jgi:hypothetical protein